MNRWMSAALALLLLALPLFSLAWAPERFYETRDELPQEVNALLDNRLQPGEAMLTAHKSGNYIHLLSKTAEDARRLFIFEQAEASYTCIFESGVLPEHQGMKAGIISSHHSVSLRYGEGIFFSFDRFGEDWLLSRVQAEDSFLIKPFWVKADLLAHVFTDELPPEYGLYTGERNLMHITAQALPASYVQVQNLLDASALAVVSSPNPQDRLHLRVQPDRKADSLGKFYNGTPLIVLADQGTWLKVKIGSLTGWMMQQYTEWDPQPRRVSPAFPWALSLREGYEDKPRYTQPGTSSAHISQVDWGYALGDIIGVIDDEWYILMNGAGDICFMRQEWFWGGNG